MQNKEINFNLLEQELKKYMTKKDITLIKNAYTFSKEYLDGKKRKNGETYLEHSLQVAIILTTIYADCDTIIASLLHDITNHSSVSLDEIETKYGKIISELVDGVVKINNIHVSIDSEQQIEYFKKIIVGMSKDVRVIIIKLADKLHNMRTLYVLPKESQKANAKESLEILAPIAHRLGMNKIKSELEDLSLRYLKPDVYLDITEKLNNTKLERETFVAEMMKNISALLKENGIKHEIKGRAKSVYSIYKKLDTGRNFNDIYDLLAIRVIVDKEQECYTALGLIHSKYKAIPKRFKDYIAMPKSNLYQTLHTTVFGKDGNAFEIQIRTHKMDEIAENGIASHWAYKEHKDVTNSLQNVTEQKLHLYKSLLEINKEKMSNEDFISSIKDEVLSNSIYVFTPKGDVIELPVGSTPIDFAYRVHSEVGDKMTGAIVNEKIVPLSYELKSSDVIKIITNAAKTGPKLEWLNIARTTQAKNKIKAFFNKNNKEDYIIIGKQSLEKELRKQKIVFSIFYEKENIDTILKNFKLDSIDDLYLNIGNNKFSPQTIINSTLKEDYNEETNIKPEKIVPKKIVGDIIVGNMANIKTSIALCCNPVPGDNIIGYITKNNGISIHRSFCKNILNEEERILSAKWNNDIIQKYLSEIVVYTTSENNKLLDFVQAASNLDIVIEKVNTNKTEHDIIYSLSVRVKNSDVLNKYINEIKKIKHVKDAERVI